MLINFNQNSISRQPMFREGWCSNIAPCNLRIFDCRLYPGGGKFEPCLAGVGNLNQKCRPSRGIQLFYLSIWRRWKVQFNLAREWLRRKHMQGLDFKTWAMNRKWWSLILHLKRNVPSNPVFEWGIWAQICLVGLELERTIFIISNTWKRRGSLNLRIDRRVMTDKLKASMPGFPESCSSLQTFRTDKYSRTCVIFLSNFWELYQENGEWILSWEFDLEGQNSDVSGNGMVWGTCRWVFKILELLTLLGCFALLRRENEAESHQKEELF